MEPNSPARHSAVDGTDQHRQRIGAHMLDCFFELDIGHAAAGALKPCAQWDFVVFRFALVWPKEEAKNNRGDGCRENYEDPSPFHATRLAHLS